MKFLKQAFVATVAAVACHSTVNAALVQTWDVETMATWTDARTANGTAIPIAPTDATWGEQDAVSCNFFQLIFGCRPSSGQEGSSLFITNPGINGNGQIQVQTYTGNTLPEGSPYVTDTVSITHQNNPISGSLATLASATLSVSMKVKDASAGSDAETIDLGIFDYNIKFVETTNTAGQCAVVSPTPCNDIFVLVDGLLDQSFEYGGYSYYVNAFPVDGGALGFLTDAACQAAQVEKGCLGFTTPENQSTTLQFGLSITAQPLGEIVNPTDPIPEPTPQQPTPVSEPAAWAVLGLALLGASIGRRRAKAQA